MSQSKVFQAKESKSKISMVKAFKVQTVSVFKKVVGPKNLGLKRSWGPQFLSRRRPWEAKRRCSQFLKSNIIILFSGGQSKIFQGHGDPVESAVILPDGRKSAVGYSDGSMRIFELRTGEVVHNLSLFKNKAAICAIDSR
jgi:WD40 repeat protein